MNQATPTDLNTAKAKELTMVVYALQAASFLIFVTGIVAIIINYVKRDEVRGTFLESHFDWQIRTFWFGLLWTVIGVCTAWAFVGFLILFANFIWGIYRIVKGWLNLNDNKPMYAVSVTATHPAGYIQP